MFLSKNCLLPLMLLAAVAVGGCASDHKEYRLTGLVVGKNRLTQEIMIKHDDIPGFMPAMTMPYQVKNIASFSSVEPGDSIAAKLIVPKNAADEYWLEDVKIMDSSKRGQLLEIDASSDVATAGGLVPDIPLVNQDGRVIHFSQFQGKAVLVTFVYTRCPFPNFCPLISSHFAAIHRELEKTPDAYARTHLLSISFDPSYDQPPVLKKYGLAYLDDPAGFAQWDFASPAPSDLHKLAQAFGLYYVPDGNQIAHSMDTVLISPDGTIAKSWLDNQWQVEEVLDALVKESEVHDSKSQKAGE